MIGYAQPGGNRGGGILSLIQGMQAGQQMRETDTRYDMLQQQVEDMKDEKAMIAANDLFYQKMTGGDVSFDEINKNIAKNDNRVTDQILGPVEMPGFIPTQVPTGNKIQRQIGTEEYMEDVLDGEGNPIMEMIDGKSIPKTIAKNRATFEEVDELELVDRLPNEFLNKFEKDTGIDISKLSPEEQKDFLSKQSFKHGDKFGTYETMMTGSSRFREYAKDKQRQERMKGYAEQKMKNEAMPRQGKAPSDIDQFSILDNKENLSPQEQTKLNTLRTKLGIDKGYYTDLVANSNVMDKLNAGDKVSDSDINQLVADQAKGGNKFAGRKDLASKVSSTSRMVDTYKDLDTLTSKYDTGDGWAKGAEQELLKMTSSEDFKAMKPKAQQEVLANAIKKTTIFTKVFDVIKEQSGAAFTEDEYARRLSAIAGGDPSKINSQTLKTAFGTFVGEEIKNSKEKLSNISPLYKGDKAYLTNSLNKGTKGFTAPSPETFSTPGGTKGAAETARNVPAAQVAQVAETAGVTSIVDSIKNFFSLDSGKQSDTMGQMIQMAPSDLAISVRGMDQAEASKLVNQMWGDLSPEQKAALRAL